MRKIMLVLALFVAQSVLGQKKPLDHSVYDGWQSIGEKLISNDGRWAVYTINPQEGDNNLVIQSTSAGSPFRKSIPRGYNARITEDNRYVVFRIKPYFKSLREARIRKKKPEESPKDSLAILVLGTDSMWKAAGVKGYKLPEDSYGWVAYHLEKPAETAGKSKAPGRDPQKTNDSLMRVIDSLRARIEAMPARNRDDADAAIGVLEELSSQLIAASDAEGDDGQTSNIEVGTNLVLKKLGGNEQKTFTNVLEYYFSKNGKKLLLELSRNPKDSTSVPLILLHDLHRGFADTLNRGGNDFKNFVLTDDGSQIAYLAERDAKPKDLQKFYKLWYFTDGMDSAHLLVDKNSVGMQLGMTVSQYGTLSFSKSGKRLFFGTAPIPPVKDTSLVDIDQVKVDIWHYNDDYLQTTQLNRLTRSLQENFLAVYLFDSSVVRQLATREIPIVYQAGEGDAERFVGVTDFGKRIESQWTGNTKKDIYSINVNEGSKKLIKKDMTGSITASYVSPSGNCIMWYESKARNYFAFAGDSVRNISAKVKLPLYNEDHDVPSDPSPYGVMGWHEGDSAIYVYDKYDIWQLDPFGKKMPRNETNERKLKITNRYLKTDPDERFISTGKKLLVRNFNNQTKNSGLAYLVPGTSTTKITNTTTSDKAAQYTAPVRAKNGSWFIYTKENFTDPPDIYFNEDLGEERKLSSINSQQKDYNWGTSELYRFNALNGKMAEGLLYKPENFDPSKKYPVLFYFYERYSNTLNNYIPPAPTGSRINIPFFVSRGYIVFVPDIHYTIGYPAKSAYNYVVGAAKDLAKHKWVDAKNMGIQGQSWGGIQVAQLITMTDMFKAAWAGAPVANMTSAYGGIRWESGVNRQFQYEKTQSRIGATLWEKPELYIENSPLFSVPKIKTPLVIMSNDADGAVPWYQGIELFTAMRRLGKKVWLLNYNGEAHNLVERKNKKDIQVRQQQYFDWLLKGEQPPLWISEGVPAVKKGQGL